MRFLVFGCGSIGRRHIRNLLGLGVEQVIGCDPSPDRRREAEAVCGVPVFATPAEGWAAHPDERVDVAVVLINARVLLEAGMELGYFRPADMAFVSMMKELDIGPGEELFVLGFPMGMSGVERNYVIARCGMIARFDDEILTRAAGTVSVFAPPG